MPLSFKDILLFACFYRVFSCLFAGYVLISVGFFLSSFFLNLEGLRVLPPFIGFLIMVCGLSKIRNFHSTVFAKVSQIILIINSVISAAGSFISLSRYAQDTLLEWLLPVLPWIFAVSCILCAAQISMLMIHTSSYFERYLPEKRLWKPVCYAVSAIYSAFKIIEAAREASIAGNLPALFDYLILLSCALLFVILIISAFSNHSALDAEQTDKDKFGGKN